MTTSPATLNTRVKKVPLARLRLLEVNARYMKHEVFQRLVQNLKRDGCLTQPPFAVWDGADDVPVKERPPLLEEYLVVSGNHRLKAAIEAGIKSDFVMFADADLSADQKLALQLSHNAIVGEDDPGVLAQLYEQLDAIDWREYSGLDDQVLELISSLDVGITLGEPPLAWQTLQFLFLPEEADEIRAALDAAKGAIDSDQTLAASFGEYDRLLDALIEAGAVNGLQNRSAALRLVLSVYEAHRDELATLLDDAGRPDDWVPLSIATGGDLLPREAAVTIQKAIQAAVSRKEIAKDERWRLLERLCAEYLA